MFLIKNVKKIEFNSLLNFGGPLNFNNKKHFKNQNIILNNCNLYNKNLFIMLFLNKLR